MKYCLCMPIHTAVLHIALDKPHFIEKKQGKERERVLSLYTPLHYRDIIKYAVNASDDDCILFAGNGCTGAVHQLIHILDCKGSSLVS